MSRKINPFADEYGGRSAAHPPSSFLWSSTLVCQLSASTIFVRNHSLTKCVRSFLPDIRRDQDYEEFYREYGGAKRLPPPVPSLAHADSPSHGSSQPKAHTDETAAVKGSFFDGLDLDDRQLRASIEEMRWQDHSHKGNGQTSQTEGGTGNQELDADEAAFLEEMKEQVEEQRAQQQQEASKGMLRQKLQPVGSPDGQKGDCLAGSPPGGDDSGPFSGLSKSKDAVLQRPMATTPKAAAAGGADAFKSQVGQSPSHLVASLLNSTDDSAHSFSAMSGPLSAAAVIGNLPAGVGLDEPLGSASGGGGGGSSAGSSGGIPPATAPLPIGTPRGGARGSVMNRSASARVTGEGEVGSFGREDSLQGDAGGSNSSSGSSVTAGTAALGKAASSKLTAGQPGSAGATVGGMPGSLGLDTLLPGGIAPSNLHLYEQLLKAQQGAAGLDLLGSVLPGSSTMGGAGNPALPGMGLPLAGGVQGMGMPGQLGLGMNMGLGGMNMGMSGGGADLLAAASALQQQQQQQEGKQRDRKGGNAGANAAMAAAAAFSQQQQLLLLLQQQQGQQQLQQGQGQGQQQGQPFLGLGMNGLPPLGGFNRDADMSAAIHAQQVREGLASRF